MNTEIKAVHFTLNDDGREYLEKKLARIRNAENMIVDLIVTLSKDANDFDSQANVNFRWGVSAHVSGRDSMLNASIDKMMDALEQKITKEKEKVKEKR
jgi:putative sigma-54 modulation protein